MENSANISGNEVYQYLEDLYSREGLDIFGIADCDLYIEKFPEKPSPRLFIDNAKSIIVIGMKYLPDTLSTVLRPELSGGRRRAEKGEDIILQPSGSEKFFAFDERNILIDELARVAYLTAKYLSSNKYRALHIPPIKTFGHQKTGFQHIPAAYLAGLGTFGDNMCLLTPQFGPRFLMTCIITDVLLPYGKPLASDLCLHCGLCRDNCPPNALDGKGHKNSFACANYGCCRTCIAICPVGVEKVPQ